jgi:hypothetical protein
MGQTQSLIHRKFNGLVTAIADPPPDTAVDSKNMVRHRREGSLEVCDGYGLKFADGTTDLPQTTDDEGPNYLAPGLHFISNLEWENIHNFYVSEQGGKFITVATATYRKTSRYDEDIFVDRFGIWVRPYWDGTAWIDAWLELTEMHIAQISDIESPNIIEFDAAGFDDNYFKNWIIVFEDYSVGEDHDNYLLVLGSGADQTEMAEPHFLEFYGNTTDLQRNIGDKILLVRSFYGMELPSEITTHIYSLLNEARLTTGNELTDLPIMVGFRDKTFGFINNKDIDKLISTKQTLDLWRYAWGLDTPAITTEPDDPIPAGTYRFGSTLATDDGQETEMRQTFVSSTDTLLEDVWKAKHANVIATDDKYVYACFPPSTNEGTQSVDRCFSVQKLNIDTLDVVDEFKFASDNVVGNASEYPRDCAVSEDILYVVTNHVNDNNMTVYAIDTATMGLRSTNSKSAEFSLAIEKSPISCVVEGIYIYICTRTGGLKRLVKADFSGSTNLDLSGTSTDLQDIVSDGTHLYICTLDSPALVLKVSIAGFVQVAPSPLILSDIQGYALTIVGAKGYVTTLTSPAKVIRITLATLTEDGVPSPFVAGVNEDNATAIVYDGEYLYVALVRNYIDYPPLAPIRVVNRLDPVTMTDTSVYTLVNGSAHSDIATPSGNYYHLTLLSIGKYLYLNTTLLDKINKSPAVSLTLDGTTKVTLAPLISPSTVNDRFSKMRVYVDTAVGGEFFGLYVLHKEVPFGVDGGITWEADAVYDGVSKHFYLRATMVDLFGADFNNPGSEVGANIDRASTDNGAVKYKHAAPIDGRLYLAGVSKDGILYPNKLFASANHGDGSKQYDVFPTDKPFIVSPHVIDIEFNDGDEIRAIGGIDEVIIAIKRRSIVQIKRDRYRGFERKLITRLFGIASPKTLVALDDSLYWFDYSGAIIEYNNRSSKIIDYAILQDLRDLSDTVKENAIAVIDRINRQYRLGINGIEYLLDIDTGQWLIQELTDTPLRFAIDGAADTVDFLSGDNIFTLAKRASDGTLFELFNDAPIEFFYELNENPGSIDANHDEDYDYALKRIYARYVSEVDLVLELFRNGEEVAMTDGTWTLNKDMRRLRVKAPSGDARCSSYRLRVSGTKDAEGQDVLIERMGAKYEVVFAGGSELGEAQ